MKKLKLPASCVATACAIVAAHSRAFSSSNFSISKRDSETARNFCVNFSDRRAVSWGAAYIPATVARASTCIHGMRDRYWIQDTTYEMPRRLVVENYDIVRRGIARKIYGPLHTSLENTRPGNLLIIPEAQISV